MKITGILYFSVVLLLFSCGAKQDERKSGKNPDNGSVPQHNTHPVRIKTDGLDSLAAKMVASGESYPNDGNTEAEERFIEAFVEALKQPKAFETDFANLKKYEIKALSSDDHNLRIFYWLSPYSGSMWHVQNIVQYKDENNQVTAVPLNSLYEDKDDDGSPTPFFEHIYNLNTSPKKSYLLTGYGQMSGTEPYSVAHTLVIDHSKFSINQPMFNVGKAVKNQLFASAILKEDQNKEKITAQLAITFNPQNKRISYPEINETKDGPIFNGKRNVLTFRDGMFK